MGGVECWERVNFLFYFAKGMTGDMDQDRKTQNPLRDTAENKLAIFPDLRSELQDKPPEDIMHDLRVHKIEMEIQNEELKRLQLESEASKKKYQDLYDFAPVGCVAIYHSDGSMRLRQNEN